MEMLRGIVKKSKRFLMLFLMCFLTCSNQRCCTHLEVKVTILDFGGQSKDFKFVFVEVLIYIHLDSMWRKLMAGVKQSYVESQVSLHKSQQESVDHA